LKLKKKKGVKLVVAKEPEIVNIFVFKKILAPASKYLMF
jgi:hypothetical protein